MPRRTRLLHLVALVAVAAAVAATIGPPAGAAPTTGADDLRVVNVNLLHGTFCDDDTHCQVSDRVDLFLRQLEAAGCPEVVGIQEVSDEMRPMFVDRVPTTCGGDYDVVFTDTRGNDTELVLTSLPAKRPKVESLPGGLRRASRVELATPIGPVVLVVTHQDGDKAYPACRDDVARYRCPKPCPAGTTYSECQTILGLRLADRAGSRRAVRIYMGDFNVPAGSPRYERIRADGFVDSHLAAGNPECDAATGRECTAGREDQAIAALKDPTAREHERIDFIFVKTPTSCRAALDSGSDTDGDGVGTGLFAAAPAVGGPGGLVWPSDHTAVSMDLTCASSGTAR